MENGCLEYADMREHQVTDRLEHINEVQPQLSHEEYLQLLKTAKLLNK